MERITNVLFVSCLTLGRLRIFFFFFLASRFSIFRMLPPQSPIPRRSKRTVEPSDMQKVTVQSFKASFKLQTLYCFHKGNFCIMSATKITQKKSFIAKKSNIKHSGSNFSLDYCNCRTSETESHHDR